VYTSRGKVNTHHPKLNGNLLERMMAATAKKSQRDPNAQSRRPSRKPISQNVSPAPGVSILVSGKVFWATAPNFWILARNDAVNIDIRGC
jgi:hypothetical protein